MTAVKAWKNEAARLYKTHQCSEEEEALYREISKRLTDQHKWPESKWLPKIYKMMATPEQVKVLLELPATAEEIAEKLGVDKKFVEDTIQDQFEKGVIVPTRKGQWFLNRQEWQFKDATLPVTKFEGEEWWDEYRDLWFNLYLEEFRPLTSQEVTQMFRILPHWRAIEGIEGVTEYDDIREILKTAEPICVLPCACKRKERERVCQSPEHVCININRTALYNINKGAGRKITAEEALKIFDEAADWGLTMTPLNQKVIHNLICNCHACSCCDFFAVNVLYDIPVKEQDAPSRFQTVVNPEKCQGCQTCVQTCPFGAAKLKQYEGEKHPRHPLGNPIWKGWVDPDLCMGCGLCVIKCPNQARKMELVRPLDFIPDIAPTPSWNPTR